ncbi:hypothetical protein [uncultured Lactobacillus sp.]|uniref:hypothetical protein n=1 Tax=uncultured Lactobacillus sp. TaxID=153152 RepID=UPI0026129AB9|nr:hypothetical protein [uncultured Lactobacillus sp.]
MIIDLVVLAAIIGIGLLISKNHPYRIWLVLAIAFIGLAIINFISVYFSKENWDLAMYAVSFYSFVFGLIFLIVFGVRKRRDK